MSEAADPKHLLFVWLSPSFPVGAFAYSHGLEAAVARGLVNGREGLTDWLSVLFARGSVRNDMVLLAVAWRAIEAGTTADVTAQLNDLALALQPSAERHLEAVQQGSSFLTAVEAAWPCAALSVLRSATDGVVAYPVAVGVAAAGHGISLADVLVAFGMAFAQNMTSAAIRLSVIGQTDGQRAMASLMPDIDRAARFAAIADLDDIGGAALSSDLASLEHETLYSRLFRS